MMDTVRRIPKTYGKHSYECTGSMTEILLIGMKKARYIFPLTVVLSI